MKIVWCKGLNSLCNLDGQTPCIPPTCTIHFFPPLYLSVNYTTFLCWYLFWVFVSFVLFLTLCWLTFHYFIFVVLIWSLERWYGWWTGYCKFTISNRTPTNPTPGVSPKYNENPLLNVILTNMPPGKRRDGKFWAWYICCIWWDSIPLKVCCPTVWIWW